MPLGQTHAFEEGAQAQDQSALQSMLQRGQSQRIGQQAAFTEQQQQRENYTTLTPQQLQGMHPDAAKYIQSFGQAQPDGSMRFHNNLMPSLSSHVQEAEKRGQKVQLETSLKDQLIKGHTDPTTGMVNMPESIKMAVGMLGSGTAPDKIYDDLMSYARAKDMMSDQGMGSPKPGMRPTYTDEMTPTGPRRTVKWDQPQNAKYDPYASRVNPQKNSFYELDAKEKAQAIDLHQQDLSVESRNRGLNVTLGNQEGQATGALGNKAKDYYSPEKGFLNDSPGGPKLTQEEAVRAGYGPVEAWGGAKPLVENTQAQRMAENHVVNIRTALDEIVPRRPDLFPPVAASELSPMMAARLAELWKKAISSGDPDLARLRTLDLASMNIQKSLLPGGTRMGMQMMNYTADRLPTGAAQPWTAPSAYAAVDAMEANLRAGSLKTQPLRGPRQPQGAPAGPPPAPLSAAGNHAVSGSGWSVKKVQ